MAELPSGTVTFLFTDIQGSTELWDAFPDEMRAALAVHDRIVGEAIATAGGTVVKNTGDGIFAAFVAAPDAVAAAVTAQRRLVASDWDPAIGSLEVRMALHTDDIEAVEGDYHGPGVNRVARIEAAGHGGQILISDAALEAASTAFPTDVEVIDLGIHSLRGLRRAEAIHQLVVPGLRASFPPLRTASVALGRLPEFATSFVGRSADIEAIAGELAAPDCRELTLLGPGGIGKTRLAVEAARRIGERSGSVAHFVSLAAVPSPEAIIREIAASLNFTIDLHVSSMVDETTQVLDLLRSQRMILVLDNFEHLLSGAALVTRIVESAPDVSVLVTSRERLGIGAEWVFDVSGLDAGDGEQIDEAADAVALFLERARRAGEDIGSENQGEVTVICKAMGGMPLAIELAAAWTPVLPVSEIASEVQANLDFLSTSLTDIPERHRSVRAAFAQSWRRLSPALKEAFSQLAVFPAPFSRDASAEVARTTLPTLLALMNKSLLRRADFDSYDIHPLLREFGLDELGDAREATARKHAEYYIGRLLEREQRLRGSIEQIEIRDEVASELDNLRPATLWAIENLSTGEVVAALNALQPFYFLYSWAEGIDHFGEITVALESILDPEGALDDERYLWAQTLAMSNLAQLGQVERVTKELQRLLPHWEERGGVGLAACLVGLGIVADEAGELAESRRLLERAAEVGFGSDQLLELVHAAWYGWVIFEQGDVEQAQAIFGDGLDLAEAENSYLGRAYLLSKLGVAADGLGNHEEAAQYHHEGREIFVKTGDLGGQGYTLSRLSWTYWLMGDFVKAKRYGEEGLEKFDEINHRWGVAASWCRIGMAELGLGEIEAAAEAFRTGLGLAVGYQMQTLCFYALMGMGRVYAAEGRIDAATRLLAHNVHAPQNPYLELAQEALDDLADQGTEELRQSGIAMTLDQAVALAGQGRPEVKLSYSDSTRE